MFIIRLQPIQTKKVHIYQGFSIENSEQFISQILHIMSDNISADEIKRRLILFLRIPTEVWTDVLKLLPRSILVQNIAPACYRFKEISDKNVKNVHVIKKVFQFTKKLMMDGDPEASQHLELLAANDCQLASQFKLSNTQVQIGEKSKAILRHCQDLFNGCQIKLVLKEENKDSTLFLECLNHLEKAKPFKIYVIQGEDQVVDFWHHPTILNCSRIELNFWSDFSAAMKNIFDWLHHQPNGVDCDRSADQQVRCMTFWLSDHDHDDHIDWLINRCSKDIQQSQQPADRRPFVLSFPSWLWTGYGQFSRIENNLTGEVLVLDRVMSASGQSTRQFRLRRCLAEEETGGEEFYTGLFKRDEGFDVFKFVKNKPRVAIR